MSGYDTDGIDRLGYGKEYDFTDYPPSAVCIECTIHLQRDDMKQCEGGCEEWLCAGCREKDKQCATCRAEAT